MVDFLNDSFSPMDDEEDQTQEALTPSEGSVDFLNDSFSAVEETEEAEPVAAAPVVEDDEEDEYGFDTGRKYKKDDLKTGKAAEDIRDYMTRRAGKRYANPELIDNDQLVEDFVDHWRFFNTNIIGTAGEARFISTGTEEDKASTQRALELYDGLGNVFVNDGFYGAVDGIWDYTKAIATDPSNYIGLLTGGAAKAGALSGSAATKQLVRKAAAEAGMRAMKNGATREAAEKVGQEAVEKALTRHALGAAKTKTAQNALDKLAEAESRAFLNRARRGATKEVLDKASKSAGTKALGITTASDALVAMTHDYQIQSLRMEVNAQEDYNSMQTVFSSVLGGVGGGLQLAGRAFGKGKSGLDAGQVGLTGAAQRRAAQETADKAIIREIGLSKPALGKEGTEKAGKEVLEGVRSWKDKWQSGRHVYTNQTTEADLLKRIVLGSDGKGKTDGLVKMFRDTGEKLPANMRITDVITNVVEHMPQKQIEEINELLKPTHMTLGDMAGSRARLQDLVANESNRAGQVLNVFSQAKRMLDSGVVVGDDIIREATEGVLEREAAEASKVKGVAYGQNIWRRLLVSSPATTAANVAGFSTYAVGSSLADIVTGTGMTLAALGKKGAERAEYLRVGKVYRAQVAQKMRFFMDPFTTHDTYMKFIKENEAAGKVLFETVTGGIDRSAKRYGIDPNSKWFQRSEALADGANALTGVSIQDTFTKSQMFIGELDKYLRINKNMSLQDVLKSGDMRMIDDDVIGSALDGTMKSVFSKDYTRGDNELLTFAAQLTEKASNTPGIGTIIPFGRFMNNVVATAYEWGPGGLIQAASAITKAEKRNIKTVEAMSRSMVGLSAIGLAMQNDKDKQDMGLAATDIEIAGGQVADIKNVYPVSLIMVAGRWARMIKEEGQAPKELKQEFLNQLAIGQVARDVEFGNDLFALLSWFESPEAREGGWHSLLKPLGNIAAGATRPLDAVNRAVGFINDSDVAKDVRQARGTDVFTQGATKYVDNIIEVFTTDLDSITGEELRVATREGPLQDPNPAARIAGLVVKPPQNATELAYGMSEMMTYTANMRTKDPAYDKAYNSIVAPLLEKAAERMIADDVFMKGTVNERRARLKRELGQVKSIVSKYFKERASGEGGILGLRRTAATAGSPEARFAGKKMLRERGVEAEIRDLGYKELQLYLSYVDAWDNYYRDR